MIGTEILWDSANAILDHRGQHAAVTGWETARETTMEGGVIIDSQRNLSSRTFRL